MRSLVRIFILSVCLIGLAVGGIASGPAFALSEEQNLVAEVWRIVNRAYLDETFNHQNWWFTRQRVLKQSLTNRDETYRAIRTMLGSLDDPYTRLLPPEQYRSLQTSTSGELTGVGLQITKDDKPGWLRVIAPIEGSPAERAGIQPKDIVLEIDGADTTELTLDEAAARMRGQQGTTVTLKLRHGQEAEAQMVSLTRQVITLDPVYADLRTTKRGRSIGYLRLTQFNGNAAESLAHAIRTLEDAGAEGYVLDLRNNPGGLLQAGIEIARMWLPAGTIVFTVSRQGILDSFDAYGSALTDAPLVVLVNEGTASASEILAGALQDNGRAQLVGSTTFGKGLIQSLFDLSDGSGLAVTVAKYETPDHHDINRLGITPDRLVESKGLTRETFGTDADSQYRAALEVLEQTTVVAGVP
jgi:carboxyl-terminal processing protease